MSELLTGVLVGGFSLASAVASSWITARLTRNASLEAVERQQAHENRRAMLEERRRYRRELVAPLKEALEKMQEGTAREFVASVRDKTATKFGNPASQAAWQEERRMFLERSPLMGLDLNATFIAKFLSFPDAEVRRLGTELFRSKNNRNVIQRLHGRLEQYVANVEDTA